MRFTIKQKVRTYVKLSLKRRVFNRDLNVCCSNDLTILFFLTTTLFAIQLSAAAKNDLSIE